MSDMNETTADTGAESPVSPPSPRPSLASAFSAPLRVFYAPGQVLSEIRDGMPWWPGMVIMMIVALALGFAMLPLQQDLMAQEFASGARGDVTLTEDGELPAPVRYGLMGATIGGGLLGVPLMLLAVTLFYWLALLVTFGGAPYLRLLALSVYAGFIGLAYQVINIIYLKFADVEMTSMADFKTATLDLSLGAFTSGEGILAGFLKTLGVFQLWELYIFVAGAALLMRKSKGAVFGPILVIFLLGALIGAFLSTLGSSFGA
jgi:hypothetical protein